MNIIGFSKEAIENYLEERNSNQNGLLDLENFQLLGNEFLESNKRNVPDQADLASEHGRLLILARLAGIVEEIGECVSEIRNGNQQLFREELIDLCNKVIHMGCAYVDDLDQKMLHTLNEKKGKRKGKLI